MKKVTKALLIDASQRLLFSMSDAELTILLQEFDILLKQMERLGDIPGVDAAPAITFPFPTFKQTLSADQVKTPLTQAQAVSNAGSSSQGQIKLPKVVG
jgi:Asp-tRNA(Asn)/Glu-tRNA(Gln) amidotransferase C subunit